MWIEKISGNPEKTNELSRMNPELKSKVSKEVWEKVDSPILPKISNIKELQVNFNNRISIWEDRINIDSKVQIPYSGNNEIFSFEDSSNLWKTFMIYDEAKNTSIQISISPDMKMYVTQTLPTFSLIYQEI
jgi:hypothetical protein